MVKEATVARSDPRFMKVQEELRGVLQAYRNAVREIDERLEFRRTKAEIEALTNLKKKLIEAQRLSFEIAADFVAAMG
jgi:uncharacterized protein YajQ (UPF0234 family)